MRLFRLLIISVICCSCSNEILEPGKELLGSQFFPIQSGDVFRYSVEEINYRNTGEIDTSNYYLIDRIEDSTALTNGVRYEGYRFISFDSINEEVLQAISITISDHNVLLELGNKKEIIFSFPVKESKIWDSKPGPEEVDDFTYYKAFQEYELDNNFIEQSVQVIEENNQDSLEFLDTRIKVYGADIGLVYKLSSQIEFCTLSECFGLQEIEIGKTIRQKRLFE